jgi:hypothetical protein
VLTQWLVPPGMVGESGLIRVGPGAVGDEEYTCPEFTAAKVRPTVRPAAWPRWPKSAMQDFPLHSVMTVLDEIEYRGVSPEVALGGLRRAARSMHPGLLKFTRVAVANYLEGAKQGVGGSHESFDAVPHYWVVRMSGQDETWELFAWGRRYQSEDRRRRELRLLAFGEAGARIRDPVQVAISALATAHGSAASWPARWSEPFELRGRVDVEHVRVVEVGLLDGSSVVHFEGTPAQAESYYKDHGRRQLVRLLAGGRAQPGSSCSGCKLITACTTLPHAPGLLSLPAKKAPLRKVSVRDLRYYRSCPAQAHLRELNLPKQYEYSAAAERGQAVHAYLEALHQDSARWPCRPESLSVSAEGWSAGRWTLTGEQAEIGARMLARHEQVCPLANPGGVEQVRVEPTLAFYDTAVNTVVLAKPDLLYMEAGSWVWRETKTTERAYVSHADPLVKYPQLALGVLILANGRLGGSQSDSRVELETLRPDGADLDLIDPTDPERIAKARQVIGDLARPWHEDQRYPARPGPDCQTCPVSRWCPDYRAAPAAVGRTG